MPTEDGGQQVRVVCTECGFSEVVEKGDEAPAASIVLRGRETGHELCTEEVDETPSGSNR